MKIKSIIIYLWPYKMGSRVSISIRHARFRRCIASPLLFVVLVAISSAVFSYDMFDVAVCEAQPNNSSRVECFRELHQTAGLCKEEKVEEELECFKRITKSKMSASKGTPKIYYVSSETVDVRLAPNNASKVTNTLYKRQKVDVFEVKDGWGRISKYYDGSSEGLGGAVARWVLMEDLVGAPINNLPPIDQNTSELELSIRASDNFSTYQDAFIRASRRLLDDGRCVLDDFKEMGGWVRSSNYKPEPVFFTYCGGVRKNKRIYLNAKTGLLF